MLPTKNYKHKFKFIKVISRNIVSVFHLGYDDNGIFDDVIITSTINPATTPSSVYISGNPIEVVESFVYLGSEIHSSGSLEPEVLRRIVLTSISVLNQGPTVSYLGLHPTSLIIWL